MPPHLLCSHEQEASHHTHLYIPRPPQNRGAPGSRAVILVANGSRREAGTLRGPDTHCSGPALCYLYGDGLAKPAGIVPLGACPLPESGSKVTALTSHTSKFSHILQLSVTLAEAADSREASVLSPAVGRAHRGPEVKPGHQH